MWHQIHDQKYNSTVLGVSELALCPFRPKWASWASECSEWLSGNSHRSAPHWAHRGGPPIVTSPLRTIPCYFCMTTTHKFLSHWMVGTCKWYKIRIFSINCNTFSTFLGCIECMRCRLLLTMFVSLSICLSRGSPMCGAFVQLLPNYFTSCWCWCRHIMCDNFAFGDILLSRQEQSVVYIHMYVRVYVFSPIIWRN